MLPSLSSWLLAAASFLVIGMPTASAKQHRCSRLEGQLKVIEYAARDYQITTGRAPKDASVLVEANHLDSHESALDPWGLPIVVEVEPDGELHAVSAGPDSILGTPDDYRTRDRLNCPPFPRNWGALLSLGVVILVVVSAGATIRHLLRHPR